MVEKVPEFSAEFLCLRQGMVTKWALVSHDPSGSCGTSWRMTAGMSRPVSLFQGRPEQLPFPDEGREILLKIRELFPP